MITTVHNHDDVRIYHKEAKALDRAGFDVTIINPTESGTDEHGIRFFKIDVPQGRKARVMKSSKIAYIAAMQNPSDIYHIHDAELLPTALKLKKMGKKVIYDSHEDTPRQILEKSWIPHAYRDTVSKLFEWYENRVTKKLDVVICATNTIAARFTNSVVVHNYPSEVEFSQTVEEIPYQKRKDSVCYIGAITAIRGITETLRAIEPLDIKFNLAGRFENLDIKNEIEHMPAFDKVEYKGYLDREGIDKLLSESKIGMLLLQPVVCYKESLPIKLFEYMIAGIPVIASDFKLWQELIGNACVLYVDPTNHLKVREAIEFLLQNPDRAKAMGEAGRELVLKRFTFEAEERKLVRCYKKLLQA